VTGDRRFVGILGWIVAALLAGAVVAPWLRPAAPGDTWAPVYAQVAPSVVGITLEDPDPRIGSGFAVSETRVVTARHLVVGADGVTVRTVDGTAVPARVVGTDARTDLALLEADRPVFTAAELGSSADLRVGDTVLAIGNPYGLGHTLAVGIVGSPDRRLTGAGPAAPQVAFLQLTIPLNPGNSGGPVFSPDGRVVGVLAGTHAQGQSIAFAVPVEALMDVLPALAQGEQLSRAFLGARTEEVAGNVTVASVMPGGPADRAGMRAGDRIVTIDGEAVGSPEALHAFLDHLAGGTRARIGLERGGEKLVVDVELTDWAEHPLVIAGMTLRPAAGSGGEVVAVRPRSRAERAGIQIGDLVRTVDGIPVQAPADVQEVVTARPHPQVEVLRDGGVVTVQLPDPG
jgi:serine protease Do